MNNTTCNSDQMDAGGCSRSIIPASVARREAYENRVLICDNFPRDFNNSRIFRSMVETAMFEEKLKFHENALTDCRWASSETGEILLEFYNAELAARALNLNGYQFEFYRNKEKSQIYFRRHPHCSCHTTLRTPTWQEYKTTRKQHQLIKTKQENLGRVIEVHGIAAFRCSMELDNYLTDVMNERSLTLFPGYLITCIRSQKSPALVTFRTHEEAELAMQLRNLEFMGHRLQMMRPRTYLERECATSNQNHNEEDSHVQRTTQREVPQEVARPNTTDCSVPYDDLLQVLQRTIGELNEAKAQCNKLQADLDGANQKLKFRDAELKYGHKEKEELKRTHRELQESKDSCAQLRADLDLAKSQIATKDEQLVAAGAEKEKLKKDMSMMANKWLQAERGKETLQSESAIQAKALRVTEEHINSLRKNLKHLVQTEGLGKIICKHEEIPHKKRRRSSLDPDSLNVAAKEDAAKIKPSNASARSTSQPTKQLALKVEDAAAVMPDPIVESQRSCIDETQKKNPGNKKQKGPKATTDMMDAFLVDI